MHTQLRSFRWFFFAIGLGTVLLAGWAGAQGGDAPSKRTAVTTAPAASGPLRCEVIDPGFLESDCSYHGVYVDAEGQVYFTLSAHSAVTWLRIYHYDPVTKKTDLLFTPQTVTPEEGHVAHGKVHSPMAEYKGELYFATHSGYYKTSHKLPGSDQTVKPYRGSNLYAVDKKTGKGRVVAPILHDRPVTVPIDKGVPLGGEAVISTIMDVQRGLFYGLSWPSAILVKVDVATGKVTEYGPMQDGGEAVEKNLPGEAATAPAASGAATTAPATRPSASQKVNPAYRSVCRTLGMDDQGNVYGSGGYGEIWRYDRAQDKVSRMKADCRNATAASDRRSNPSQDMWRTLVWDDAGKVFWGVHLGTSWLFRFDPKADTIEPVVHWAPAGGKVADYAQLGLTMGPDRTLYGLVHGPAVKKNVQRSVHLLTLDLKSMRMRDNGPVLGENDMTVMFAETCRTAPNGDVYSSCWVEVPAARMDEVKAKRREGGVPEVRYPFVMSLIRVPAGRIAPATQPAAAP